ncbi:helix-turn-helix domain-containing protein [Limosilactobacillus fermentum]|uniref:helix-turn-helix domain-containing protein n=1 Tax=Limosilactobacillus fermentum TaxID=1613 RepID=UPI0013C53B2D|nr:helix-turn-helix transcriptional regulator [Limosilactobacillus fermentum]MCE0560894.1 helix-turn-helix domain-containing protein [Limosilactobacillus fermentum]QID95012.1 helix-turn-helix domain-containing protein [Limosilactobacillus fermentum]
MSLFSERLTNLREANNWSKTYVAKQIGLSSMQTYANWEYGRTEPDFSNVTKLADLFGVTTDYLLGRPEKNDNNNTADLADDDTIFTYKGQPLSDDDKEIIRRLMNGK